MVDIVLAVEALTSFTTELTICKTVTVAAESGTVSEDGTYSEP